MVISVLEYGFANQMISYIVGKSLALKLNTEFKIVLEKVPRFVEYASYRLKNFNIVEDFATPEEINRVVKNGITPASYEELKNVKGDVFIKGTWMLHNPIALDTIAVTSVIKKEFTLKKPFNPKAEAWKQKILSAECAVSMHFRHGDYAYATRNYKKWAPILPLDYYYTCIDILKQQYSNLTVFVFSDNLPWVKENLNLDVPIEFVENCETDLEEWVLMSLCKHNIVAYSTFSEMAAWINSNPDKKIFLPAKYNVNKVQQFLNSLTPANKNALFDSNKYIYVPYNFANQPEITMQPYFSILLVLNDDATTISEVLDSFFEQDYKWYEIIIIDNASTDDSRAICRQKIEGKKNVTFKRLLTKVNNARAWNFALSMAQGHYVSFLKGNDRFLPNSFSSLFFNPLTGATYSTCVYLEENENGNVPFGDKKLLEKQDPLLQKNKRLKYTDGQEAVRTLLNREMNSFLGTKIFNRKFLEENKIKFDKQLDDAQAELFFQLEAFFKSKYLMYISNAFYIAPPITLGGGGA